MSQIRAPGHQEVHGLNLCSAKIVFQNFSLFAKSEAVFTVSRQREGLKGWMSVLNLVKKCQCQMFNVIMYANNK